MGIKLSKQRVYHEKQLKEYCGLHCLNNLFQSKRAFTRSGLDAIAKRLGSENPERAAHRRKSSHYNEKTGNYDVNVLISALEEKGKNMVWHNRHDGVATIDLESETLMGIVVNVSSHWSTVKKIKGVWYDLDSYNTNPRRFKDTNEVREFLDYIIDEGGDILLVKNNIQGQS